MVKINSDNTFLIFSEMKKMQNGPLLDDVRRLVANGCKIVCEGTNMTIALYVTEHL